MLYSYVSWDLSFGVCQMSKKYINLCVTFRCIVPVCAFVKATLRKLGILVHSYDSTGTSFSSKHYLSSGFCISKATVKQTAPLLHLHFVCLKPLHVVLSLKDCNIFLCSSQPVFKIPAVVPLRANQCPLMYCSCWSQLIMKDYISFHISLQFKLLAGMCCYPAED